MENSKSKLKNHKDLDVWKYSVDFVSEIYSLTSIFPKEELYCLTSQMRRAAISIPSNIAEGSARKNKKEFIQFLYVSLGSASELETQLKIAYNLNYLNNYENVKSSINRIKKMIIGLIRYLQRNDDAV